VVSPSSSSSSLLSPVSPSEDFLKQKKKKGATYPSSSGPTAQNLYIDDLYSPACCSPAAKLAFRSVAHTTPVLSFTLTDRLHTSYCPTATTTTPDYQATRLLDYLTTRASVRTYRRYPWLLNDSRPPHTLTSRTAWITLGPGFVRLYPSTCQYLSYTYTA
jgi:hypothetical protein